MKYLLYCWLLVCWGLAGRVLAQDVPRHPNATDSKGRRDGLWTVWLNDKSNPTTHVDSAAYYRIVRYRHGRITDTVRDYYLSGKARWAGRMVVRRVKGKPEEQEEGLSYQYHENGRVRIKATYHRGKAEGPIRIFKEDGKLREISYFKNGKREGQAIIFFPNGQPEAVYTYQAGEQTGPARYYFHNGRLRASGQIQKGEEVGQWERHDDWRTLNNLLLAYADSGDWKASLYYAEAAHDRAAEEFKPTDGSKLITHPSYRVATYNLARLYDLNDRPADAEVYYVLSRDMYAYADERHTSYYIDATYYLAQLYIRWQIFDKAERYLAEALPAMAAYYGPESSRYFEAAMSQVTIWTARYQAADLDSAMKYLRQLQPVAEKTYGTGTTQHIQVLHQLGTLHIRRYELEVAKKYYLQAAGHYRRQNQQESGDFANLCNDLAAIHYWQEKYDSAAVYLHESIRLKKMIYGSESDNYRENLSNLLYLYATLGKYPEMKTLFGDVLARHRHAVQEAFAFMTEKERYAFYLQFRKTLDLFYAYAVRQYSQDPAVAEDFYDLALENKAILFRSTQNILRMVQQHGNAACQDALQSYKRGHFLLGKPVEEQQAAGFSGRELQDYAEMSEKHMVACYQSLIGKPKKRPTWRDIQQALQPTEAAIEIISYRDFHQSTYGYAAVLLRHTGAPVLIPLGMTDSLDQKYFVYYRNAINTEMEDEWSYRVYWAAIDQHLGSIQRVFISPDGVYSQLNIETLYDPDRQQFLADRYQIHLITNTRDLATRASRTHWQPPFGQFKVTLFGSPDFDGQPAPVQQELNLSAPATRDDTLRRSLQLDALKDLPGTREEVLKIERVLQQVKVKAQVFLEEQASERQLIAIRNPTVLHIATHGFFNLGEALPTGKRSRYHHDNPLLHSGLLLAGCQGKEAGGEGIFTAYEAMNMTLDSTQLVVLSACETGRMEIGANNRDGVSGLQRAFYTAGAKNILMSLWSVNDAATQVLMTNFYEEWIRLGDKRQAFRQAQQRLRAQYKHPYYWGAFVLVGD